MRTGKLRPDLLDRLLSAIPPDESVIVGPSVGEDAAAVAVDGRALILTTDPITFASDLIGWYAVHVNANDIAAMGAEPRWFLLTLIVDPRADEPLIEDISAQARKGCGELGVALVGGHIEISDKVTQPVAVGAMIGMVEPAAVVRTSGGRPGDAVILTGYAGVEGTALLARDVPEELTAHGITRETINRASNFLFDPGISALPAARAAIKAGKVTAMHDPTEGGIATGLLELASASGTGLRVDRDRIAALPETTQIAAALDIDPLGLISSGSLLIAARPDEADTIASAIRAAGIPAEVVGELTSPESGTVMAHAGSLVELPRFDRDELARFFDALR